MKGIQVIVLYIMETAPMVQSALTMDITLLADQLMPVIIVHSLVEILWGEKVFAIITAK